MSKIHKKLRFHSSKVVDYKENIKISETFSFYFNVENKCFEIRFVCSHFPKLQGVKTIESIIVTNYEDEEIDDSIYILYEVLYGILSEEFVEISCDDIEKIINEIEECLTKVLEEKQISI